MPRHHSAQCCLMGNAGIRCVGIAFRFSPPEYGARDITQHAALRTLGTCSSWPLQPTSLPPTTRTALGLDGSSTCQKELPVVVPAVPIPPWGVPFFLFAHPASVLGLETETIQNGNGPLVAAHPGMRLQFRCLSYTQHPATNIRDHIDHSPSTMHAVLSCLFPQAPFFFTAPWLRVLHGHGDDSSMRAATQLGPFLLPGPGWIFIPR